MIGKCAYCGKEFSFPNWRKHQTFCSRKCHSDFMRTEPIKCDTCGKLFQRKKSRWSKNVGNFCSRECFCKSISLWRSGENHPHYGLKGDKSWNFKGSITKSKNGNTIDYSVYAPHRLDANKKGRVVQHRLLVEENWWLFNIDAFDIIDGQHIIKDNYVVHHKDGNHTNNELSNLELLSRSEHTFLHNQLFYNLISKKGRIVARVPLPIEIEFVED